MILVALACLVVGFVIGTAYGWVMTIRRGYYSWKPGNSFAMGVSYNEWVARHMRGEL